MIKRLATMGSGGFSAREGKVSLFFCVCNAEVSLWNSVEVSSITEAGCHLYRVYLLL